MMSLPIWLPGPMVLPGGLCAWSHVPSRGTPSGREGLHPWGFLPKGSLSGESLCLVGSL